MDTNITYNINNIVDNYIVSSNRKKLSVGFLITGHGTFASGLYSALKCLNGDYDNVEVVDFIVGDSINDYDKKLNDSLLNLSIYNKVIVLCDLFAGTPFNRVMINLVNNQEKYCVFGGVNLPITIEAIMAGETFTDINALINYIKDVFKDTLIDGTEKLD
ncbi:MULTISPECIES: PTS sugar transporter subunit IIA [Clostridium]|uniref:PTS sugar transporter subunit IIA n=1 Tax=Clostridium TaxID=1485 RepID=UPI0018978481|nr:MULTISPECIES: PTS sugar transporter subunit IIA [Clostridium]MCR1952607.1 PTS sugar transporter subunit IIA [Clostridium sp. DSM 100503]MDI9215390.1 PTS sugar transporter subunit IIA [Clostridium tertium]